MQQKSDFIRFFREVQPKFSRLYTSVLDKAKLTLPQYALLNELLLAGTVPMTLVSKKLHISKPAVTHLVDRLEKAKLIKRLPHPRDRRIYLLEIQPNGKATVKKVQTFVLDLLLKSLSNFNADEKQIIVSFYGTLSRTLDQALLNLKRP